MNKKIIVTGVASGIGAQTAKVLKEQGAEVISFDLRQPEENVDQFIPVDLSVPASIEEAVSQVPNEIDGLCNIAGVPPTKDKRIVLKVNALGTRLFTESLIHKMNNEAAIVNVASLAGSGWSNRLPTIKAFLKVSDFSAVDVFCEKHDITDENCYPFTKEVLIVWTIMYWNTWLKRGIRMNCVSPGPVKTPILKDFRTTIGKRFKEEAKLLDKKAATVNDIAPVIAFLCSDKSRWIRGTNIPVDGGMAAQVTKTRFDISDC